MIFNPQYSDPIRVLPVQWLDHSWIPKIRQVAGNICGSILHPGLNELRNAGFISDTVTVVPMTHS